MVGIDSPARPTRSGRLGFVVNGFILVLTLSPFLIGDAGGQIAKPIAFLFLTCSAGLYLIIKSPSLYLRYALWLWFLVPFIRRVFDLSSGYSEMNIYGLAPVIVSLLPFIALARLRGSFPVWNPLLPSLIAVTYGWVIGVVAVGPAPATFALTQWVAPLGLALHIAGCWQEYDQIRKEIVRVFLWALVILGIYGMVQYALLPPWDLYWMTHAPINSIGQPHPFKVRVFSTMNSPMVLAPIVLAGILLIFNTAGRIGWISVGFGLATLLLSLVRSSWGALVVGFAVLWMLVFRYQPARALRMGVVGGILIALLSTVIVATPLFDKIQQRFDTLDSYEHDVSFHARERLYAQLSEEVMFEVVGRGLGAVGISQALSGSSNANTTFDSGALELPLVLGIFGSFLYITPFILILVSAVRSQHLGRDPTCQSAIAVMAVYFVQMIFANRLAGPASFAFFVMVGLLLAAKRHFWQQENKLRQNPRADSI
ncbi:putative transmembrane protein [Magnetospirillum fulvum MGU-K5]|uniref:Putative transmembrane protein n=1 Tax=Magnetospirillum fulvum MGU-K5 TaxID=1316936 RepID=S9SEN3_MAGFU|nr:putative transmembrane protein [Magnetospirillum fulvum MGU-K5]